MQNNSELNRFKEESWKSIYTQILTSRSQKHKYKFDPITIMQNLSKSIYIKVTAALLLLSPIFLFIASPKLRAEVLAWGVRTYECGIQEQKCGKTLLINYYGEAVTKEEFIFDRNSEQDLLLNSELLIKQPIGTTELCAENLDATIQEATANDPEFIQVVTDGENQLHFHMKSNSFVLRQRNAELPQGLFIWSIANSHGYTIKDFRAEYQDIIGHLENGDFIQSGCTLTLKDPQN